ncbi:MAG: hypothetical protein IJ693_06475 [Bacteroidaceae bacterium]|nr:hypothetical protein [Bacteroidaceae bacterium]
MKTLRIFTLGVAAISVMMALAQSPEQVEYFLDTDPGYGLGKVVSNIQVGDNRLTFDVSDVPDGAHVLYVRSQDDQGVWSATMSRPLFIDRLQDIVYMEYFFDGNDPGIGKAISVALPEQDYKAHLDFSFSPDISALDLGEHEISVRARDAFDVWTDMMSGKFTIVEANVPEPPAPAVGDLARLEYFFDIDPGYGMGKPLLNPCTGTNIYQMSFEDVEAGAHVLYLRAQDENGVWSSTLSRPLYVLNPSDGKIVALEYFFDDTDPGEGKAVAVTLPSNLAEPFTFDVKTEGLTVGDHQFNLRAQADTGKWSVVSSESFELTESDGIANVTWTFPISVKMQDGVGLLVCGDNVARGNCQIEVFSVSGVLLASTLWRASDPQLSVPLSVPSGSVLIVKVTDVDNGKQVVKRLVGR